MLSEDAGLDFDHLGDHHDPRVLLLGEVLLPAHLSAALLLGQPPPQ